MTPDRRRSLKLHCSSEDVAMRSFDLTPLFRSTVGFDHLAQMLDATARLDDQAFSYPPYNIEKLGEDAYRVTMAVAGFGPESLEIVAKDRTLTVSGKSKEETAGVQYLHRGVAGRAFERRFDLADYVVVKGASLDNGLLHIELAREVPEAMKPRTIAIAAGGGAKATKIEQKAA
jgi:molecular chaperone IbpA